MRLVSLQVAWSLLLLLASCGGKSSFELRGDSAPGFGGSGGQVSGLGGSSANGVAGMGDAQAASDCALPADYVCVNQYAGSEHPGSACSCQPAFVTGEKNCAHTEQLSCACGNPYNTNKQACVPESLTPEDISVVCHCELSAPVVASDCPHTQQFHCYTEPLVEGCYCDPRSPLSAADCGFETFYGCLSYNPDTSCDCVGTFR